MSGMGPWADREMYEQQKKAPVKVVLSPGSRLLITLEGCDGDFEILFDTYGDQKLRVLASFPDSSGRGGDSSFDELSKIGKKHNPEIYCEDFGENYFPSPAQEKVDVWDGREERGLGGPNEDPCVSDRPEKKE